MQKNESARKLVLNKETLHNMIASPLDTTVMQIETSCGEPCCDPTNGQTA